MQDTDGMLSQTPPPPSILNLPPLGDPERIPVYKKEKIIRGRGNIYYKK